MPFTLSHPAAIAPLWPLARRARLPLAALAIGAMVPDFEYFVHMRPLALWGHSIAGLFVFCLPVGFASLAAWELVMRGPTRRLLGLEPDAPGPRDWTWWPLGAAAIVIGAATHVAWDGLTHAGRWGERLFPALATPAFTLRGFDIPWYVVLDYASTILGGIVVLTWLGRTLWRSRALHVWSGSPWRVLTTAAIGVAGILIGLVNLGRMISASAQGFWEAEFLIARLAVGVMLGTGVALLLFSALHRLVARYRPAVAAPARRPSGASKTRRNK